MQIILRPLILRMMNTKKRAYLNVRQATGPVASTGFTMNAAAAILLATMLTGNASARHLSIEQVTDLMDRARAQGVAGEARKSKPVDTRPARAGEVVVTMIAGEGRETQSHPAATGDWVVRNRCPQTGNEQYLVDAAVFAERYEFTGPPRGSDGWRAAAPKGKVVRYFVVTAGQGEFTFDAPWGERMVARPGDAIVQDPDNPRDTYRVAAASFSCSYEILG